MLVDRLWPRGFRKGDPRVGRWIPRVAPPTERRDVIRHGAVTAVTATRDVDISHVAVLAKLLS